MKKFKTLLSILAVTLILSSVGCTSGTKASNKSIKFNEGDINFNGKVVTIGIWTEASIPTEGLNDRDDILLKRIIETEQKFNCKIEWKIVSNKSEQEFLKSIKSGEYVADIVDLSSTLNFPTIANENIVIPLDEYINYKKGTYSNEAQNSTLWNGKHYGISTEAINFSLGLLSYNKNIIQSEGLKDPLSMQQNGNWTWGEFLDIAKKQLKI